MSRLLVALAAVVGLAAYVAAWSAGVPGPLPSYGHTFWPERSDVTSLMAFLAVLTTVFAILAGMVELRHALPQQHLDLNLRRSTDGRPLLWLDVTAREAIAVHWQVVVQLRDGEGEPLGSPVLESSSRRAQLVLFPDAPELNVLRVQVPASPPPGMHATADWWTERNSKRDVRLAVPDPP